MSVDMTNDDDDDDDDDDYSDVTFSDCVVTEL